MPWIPTITTDEVEREGLASAKAGNLWVALYSAAGKYYATSILCSHGQASLADGYLEDFLIECPLHQGTFDIRTGAAMSEPCTVPIRTFPVKVEGDMIHIELSPEEA